MTDKINIKDMYMGIICEGNKEVDAVVCMPIDDGKILDLEHIQVYPRLATPIVKRGVVTYQECEITNMISLELLIKAWGYNDELNYMEIKQMLYKMNHDEIEKVLVKCEKEVNAKRQDLLSEFINDLKLVSNLVLRYNEVYNQKNKKLVLSK